MKGTCAVQRTLSSFCGAGLPVGKRRSCFGSEPCQVSALGISFQFNTPIVAQTMPVATSYLLDSPRLIVWAVGNTVPARAAKIQAKTPIAAESDADQWIFVFSSLIKLAQGDAVLDSHMSSAAKAPPGSPSRRLR